MTPEPIYSFEIDRAILGAMSLFQSSDETRTILCATLFEIRGSGSRHELTMIATDGKRLATFKDEVRAIELTDETPAEANLLLDLKGVKKLPKIKGESEVRVTVYEKHVVFACGKFRYEAKPVDGPFPNWRQCVPSGAPVAIADFPVNFELLASFGAAAKLITKESKVVLHTFGEGAAIGVTFPSRPEFRGVVMPLRLDDSSDKGVERTESTKASAAARLESNLRAKGHDVTVSITSTTAEAIRNA